MLVLGLLADGHTVANLKTRLEQTVNFPGPDRWHLIESIADTTRAHPVPVAKSSRHAHENDKFGLTGLTKQASELVAPRIQECDLRFEATVRQATQGVGDYFMVEAEVVRVHTSRGP